MTNKDKEVRFLQVRRMPPGDGLDIALLACGLPRPPALFPQVRFDLDLFERGLEMAMQHSEEIRDVLAKHARLAVPVESLSDDSSLYEAGLTSLTTVNLMLAVEDKFDLEFPDSMLSRKTFSSIRALGEAVEHMLADQSKVAAHA